MLRRMAGSFVRDAGDHLIIKTPRNPTFHWGNFVLVGDDFAKCERWFAVFAREFPEAAHIAIGLDGVAPSDERLAGYIAAGLQLQLPRVLVSHTVPAADAPADAICRPLQDDDDWDQALDLRYDTDENTSAEHRLFLRRRVQEARELTRAVGAAWFGAFVGGRMCAGAGIASDGHGLARYQNVETHPEFRRRGLARALVAAAGRHAFAELRARTLVIVADPDYHAIDLYRSLGFVDAGTDVELSKAGY